jgi:uncharacterized membrane protein
MAWRQGGLAFARRPTDSRRRKRHHHITPLEPGIVTSTQQAPGTALNTAHLVYALHSLAIVVGVLTSATVVGSFVGSVPSIIAVILNYAKRHEARGTWLESHYRWQIRTFWYALLWMIIASVLIFTVIGIVVGVPVLIGLTLWVIYRVIRGWLRLRDAQPMYA